jgi:phosphatidylglycerol---prolipoprotein diacylglyceryl transferase
VIEIVDAMFPSLLRITIPHTIPWVLLLLGLTAALLAAALGLLVGEARKVVIGLLVAGTILAMLLLVRVGASQAVRIRISPFGIGLCISIVLGSWFLLRSAESIGVRYDEATKRLCYMLIGGLVGARVGDWVLHHGTASSWFDLVNFQRGGLFGYGAYIGGLIAVHFTTPPGHKALANWLDHVSMPLLFGVGLTRVGCYCQGCDFGRPLRPASRPLLAVLGTFPRWEPGEGDRYFGSPAWISQVSHWGLSPDAPVSLPVHPVQLYEAALAFCLLLLVLVRRHENRPAGTLFLPLSIAYGLGYFLLGFLRGDLRRSVLVVARMHWRIPVGSHEQLIALGSCVLALFVWKSWKYEQGFVDQLRQIFRAAQTKTR